MYVSPHYYWHRRRRVAHEHCDRLWRRRAPLLIDRAMFWGLLTIFLVIILFIVWRSTV
jgi:hypothetical protein